MNSLESVCSFAKSTPVTFHQFQQDVDPLFRCQVRVELIICEVCILETAKDLNDSVHARNFNMQHQSCCERSR